MASKCVHKGCGKVFSDPDEPCIYHPGPPEFHEGQKGWKCCKPRVLTFDEFMTIPPCTTGKHSTVDDTPAPTPKANNDEVEAKIRAQTEQAAANLTPAVARVAVSAQPPPATSSPAPPEDEDDDPDLPIPSGATCKRRGCGQTYTAGQDRDAEQCVHHPGQALFHEGSKGWTCCKKRVLEFDEFMRIPGCKTKSRHCFIGQKKDASKEEELADVRNDFYQTATTVIASLYLKKIDKERSKVDFTSDGRTLELDLHTADHKHYQASMQLFGSIKSAESTFKIMGTKLELTLAKADGAGWPVLRATDPHTGSIIQAGRAGKV
ncbi:HSP20-like chaperone [Neohortaea acidophila]|uniref:HSP20-like chaperone n=1 Tax=Neohortaea acidophila TaxID=245834 RepID=A0A6A6Q3Q3_9PEZI|nr:HSP20-like chaperone [Neohortaea acidophila]KAF2486925.1 HSP20-like chaperone [Neohortaea acidophila]